MRIFLSHKSALEFWRLNGRDLTQASLVSANNQTSITSATVEDKIVRILNRERFVKDLPLFKPHVTREKLPAQVPSSSLLLEAHRLGASFPIDVLFSKNVLRCDDKRMREHTLFTDAPYGGFIKVSKDVVVCSPELCFLQMATLLELPKLIMLGYELCGNYMVLKTGSIKRCKALTTVQRLRAFIAKMSGAHGSQKALRALGFIQNGAESPMEIRLTMLLTLPYRLGGYGLPFPELNHVVVPTKSARASADKTFYRCDLYWPIENLDVEYDSDAHHLGSERIAADAIRRNALESLGVSIIVVTREQFYDLKKFDKLARQIASKLKRRLRYDREFANRHAELRKAIASF